MTRQNALLDGALTAFSSIDIGANASAEEAEETLEDASEQVIDIVDAFRLNKTEFDKKSYLLHLKGGPDAAELVIDGDADTIYLGYMKKVKEALKEKDAGEAAVTSFEKNAQAYAKKIVAGFKDYDFYVGESMDPDGM